MIRSAVASLGVLVMLAPAPTVRAEEEKPIVPVSKHALLIGYSDYSKTGLYANLPSVVNDVKAMKQQLSKLGFEVETLDDAAVPNRESLDAAVNAWIKRSADVDFCLLYYSGHAAQRDFTSFLIPPRAAVHYREDLDQLALSLERVLGTIRREMKGATVVIIDGCRTGLPSRPSTAQFRVKRVSGNRASYQRREYMVVYATEVGVIAGDHHPDNPDHSVFTWEFLKQLDRAKGRRFGDLLQRTKMDVMDASEGYQAPDARGFLSYEYVISP